MNDNKNEKRNFGTVKKGWGSEEIFVSNDSYCGKFLNFNRGARFSMHFHKTKKETWYVQTGRFILNIIDTSDASIIGARLGPGSVWTIEPLVPHQLICIEEGTILEISTPDSIADNYRVMQGDSQNES